MGLRRSLCEVGIGAEAWSLRLGSWGWLGKPVPGRGNRTQEDTEARAVGRSEGKTGKSVVEAREKWVAELERGAGREPVGLCISGCDERFCVGAFDSPSARLQLRTVPLDVWTSVQPQACCPSTFWPSSWTSGLWQTDRFPVFSGQTDISTSKEEMRVF